MARGLSFISVKRLINILTPLACAALIAGGWSANAWAETYSEATVSDLAQSAEPELPAALRGETEIEQLTTEYHESLAQLAEVTEKVAELQAQIDEVEAELPAQQARSDAGIRQRYKMQENSLQTADMLLSSESLDEFLREVDDLERISRANLEEFNKLREMKRQLDEAKAEQERLQAEAQERLDAASSALGAKQAERAGKQASGIASSRSQAWSEGGNASVGRAADGGEQPEDYREAATTDTSALDDGANWYADRDEFIAEWTPRIDAYLAGSALAGQGKNFAASAWKYCVDPRWSPAIANTESSKGAYCIRAYNAWGWGAADSDPYGLASEWGSWEEAIDAHVAGLAQGYGYTISLSGARAYCPITWQSWYNKTLGEMAQI